MRGFIGRILKYLRVVSLHGIFGVLVCVFALRKGTGIFYAPLNPFKIYLLCSITVYLLTNAVYIMFAKKNDSSIIETYLDALRDDVIEPLENIVLFYEVITGIHKIEEDSFRYVIIDFTEVLIDFLISGAMIAFQIYGYISYAADLL